MQNKITEYYNNLATVYDEDRFNNSYGTYIHQQEVTILNKYIVKDNIHRNLDIACGTGRFLPFANYGIDISKNMVEVSRTKFPTKKITVESATNLSFESDFFENVLSFHLIMHLNQEIFDSILKETHRVIKKGGYFIFDVPSKKRRKLTNYKAQNWHGGFQLDIQSIKESIHGKWKLEKHHGIAFFPIHLIPKKLRFIARKLDSIFCNSFLKEYSSHLIIVLKKL